MLYRQLLRLCFGFLMCILPTVYLFSSDPVQDREFAQNIVPLLEDYCLDCHDSEIQKGDMDISSIQNNWEDQVSAFKWQKVLEQIQSGVMPPVDKTQPTHAQKRQLIDWLQQNLLASPHGSAYQSKLLLPEYGNYVDHEKLFDGTISAHPYSPSRIWRKSPYIFESINRVSKSVKSVQNPYDFSTPKTGVRDYAFTSLVGASTVETLLLNANAELEWQLTEAKKQLKISQDSGKEIHRNWKPFLPFLSDELDLTLEHCELPIRNVFFRLVSREPTPEELDKYVNFLLTNIHQTKDREGSLKTTLKAIYLSPETIYRMEWGLGPEDVHGRRLLSPSELAYALSYALYDTGPYTGGRNGAGLIGEAEKAGQLNTKEDVARIVSEILDKENYPAGRAVGVPRLMRFFREFFGYMQAPEVFKDNVRVREHGIWHDPRRLVQDTDNLIKVILRKDQNVFENLLTTNEALIFHAGDNQVVQDAYDRQIADLQSWDEERVEKDIQRRKAGVLKKPKYKSNPKLVPGEFARIEKIGKTLLADKKKELAQLLKSGPSLGSVKSRNAMYTRAYNVEFRNWKWPRSQPLKLPASERAGILTQPAWLVKNSLNDETDPIHRGIWVYEKLLAGVLADVPPDVDAQVPHEPTKTLQERLSVVREKRCWACHQKINPLGEAFEIFDDFGRFRSQHFFNEDGQVHSKSHFTTKDEEGRDVLRSYQRDEKVLSGQWLVKPIDASGSFDSLDIPGLKGDFKNAIDMMHRIAQSKRTRQSIIRHMFRYFMGRNEMLSDSKTLLDADNAYLQSGGSFKAVVLSLLTSDSFLYRR